MDFYVPSTLSSDFSDMLDTFGTSVTINYNSATPVTNVRIQLSRKSTQNTFQNLSDNGRTLRFKLTDQILKGDYLTDTINNITYLVSWNPYKDINSYRSQAQICNTTLNFEKWQEAILDNITGETATPAQYVSVASNVVCFTSRTGMGIFDNSTSDIGIVPQGQVMVGLQYSGLTSLIQIGDEFNYRGIQYLIKDIDYSQLLDINPMGIIVLFASKKAGGV